VCVIRNGYIIKQINSSAPEKICAKISSSRDTSWIVFNVCGTGKRKQCKIHTPTSKHQEHLIEYSLGNNLFLEYPYFPSQNRKHSIYSNVYFGISHFA
jgi:hypothetical protein